MLSVSAVDTEANLSEVVPSASRLSATKLVRSPAASFKFATAFPTWAGSLASRPVTAARFWFSCRSRPLLSRSADTRAPRFLKVPHRSLLWSPSAETTWDNLMTVSRIPGPWPRTLSAAVSMKEPNVLTPPGWVGCSVWVSFSSC